MKYTKEDFDKAVKAFIEMDSGNRSFTEAYEKKEPFYYKRHKTLIVPSEIINHYFGCSLFRMSADVVELLQNNGGKRACRQIYESGKQSISVQCWVINVE